ncbi:DUF2577 domain-containing protein [Paenibacillus tritici]|jgi:hypothetical protein|uniref:DUF2577 domain-containing protein n=1 Tax=Paenibacillus tritici TaxID=1873425 RepID=A0ABX2DV95_9BACL|nr:DUF2577 domain-containing protein [Paenibacillus tritici]NQX48626.1 DUF2577 domain-containing protein [Paenibacillus tritici]QUL54373.1 DUF2577 domain-containing protein [Paenibacillus tritici]
MLDIIKQASLGAVSNTNPVAFSYGTVILAQPLQIQVEQRFILSGPALVVLESVMESSAVVEGREILLRRGLEAGDRVLLVRMQGGQSYIVLDRLVDL